MSETNTSWNARLEGSWSTTQATTHPEPAFAPNHHHQADAPDPTTTNPPTPTRTVETLPLHPKARAACSSDDALDLGLSDDALDLEGGDEDIRDPEEGEEGGRRVAGGRRATQLAAVDSAPQVQREEADEREYGKDDDAEAEAARLDDEVGLARVCLEEVLHRGQVAVLGCPLLLDRSALLDGGPVDGTDGPREAQAQEDVDAVGAGDVADASIGGGLGRGRGLGGEQVGHARAEGDEGDGGDAGVEAAHATEEAGEVANDNGHDGDEGQADGEGRPAAAEGNGRHKGEGDLVRGRRRVRVRGSD